MDLLNIAPLSSDELPSSHHHVLFIWPIEAEASLNDI
jgi:hypothetical protein